MSPSASAAGSQHADADGVRSEGEPPISDSDVEVEYEDEDMDVEEEIVEEIEVEEEEDDSSGSANSNDVSKVREFEEHDRTMGSGPGTTLFPSNLPLGENHNSQKLSSLPSEQIITKRGKPYMNHEDAQILKSRKPLNFAEDMRNQEFVVGEKDGVVPKSATLHHVDQDLNSKGAPLNCEIMVAEPTSSTFVSSEMVTSMSKGYSSRGGFNGTMSSLEEVKQEVLSENEEKRTISRSAALETSGTSSSHCIDYNNDKKRPALICNFFAKGWCIKGNKCRFLHIKDKGGSFSQQPDGEVAAAKGKKIGLDEGFTSAAERPTSLGTTDTCPSTVRNMTSSSYVPSETNDRLLSFQGENVSSSASKQLSPFQNDTESFQVVEQRGLGPHMPTNDNAKSRGIFIPDIISSSGSFVSSDKSLSLNKPSHAHGLEGLACRSDYATEYHVPPALNHLVNPSFNTSQQMAGDLPSCHASSWIRSMPFGSSSSASPLGAQKLFAGAASWSGASPFLASEPEKFLCNRLVGARQYSAHHTKNISSDDWEPSVPFRPSFFITSSIISSSQDQYDPLRDSIDSPKVGERSFKFSFSAEGASVLNATYHQTYGDSTSTGTPIGECKGDKSTTSVRDTDQGCVLNKCLSSQKDLHTTEGKTEGNYEVGVQHGTMAKEEISSVASHVKGISKVSKVDVCHDGRHHSDGSSSKKDLKRDRDRRKNEDVKHKSDMNESKLSKSSKHFRAALVDFVKELLKPSWHECRISKDVHNTIVKKAIEKVLSTLQPHQIPSTVELAKQYLSSSQAKISKLVQGYVAKYGKS